MNILKPDNKNPKFDEVTKKVSNHHGMKNYLLILLTQKFPTYAWGKVKSLRANPRCAEDVAKEKCLFDIDYFSPEVKKTRRALVMLGPKAWRSAVKQYPNIRLYNHAGFIYSLVNALNSNGYLVDLVEPNHSIKLKSDYDIFVGHGGYCEPILDQLKPTTIIYQYISGLYWRQFEAESEDRYIRFFRKHGVERPQTHRRDIKAMIGGLERLNDRADILFTINCPRMVKAYGKYAHKFCITGLGAYLDELFKIDPLNKDFDEGRKNFIYVGGTSGNLQKGMDLLIESFAMTPELNLYIYCKVEEEILKYCKKELSAPNIHYIYHWRYKPFHKRLKKLLRKTNFSVHAPINTGLGTAFSATMGVGLIPVGYIDLPEQGEGAILTDSWKIDDLVDCVRKASQKSSGWCKEASRLTIEKYSEYCDPKEVQKNLTEMFSLVK